VVAVSPPRPVRPAGLVKCQARKLAEVLTAAEALQKDAPCHEAEIWRRTMPMPAATRRKPSAVPTCHRTDICDALSVARLSGDGGRPGRPLPDGVWRYGGLSEWERAAADWPSSWVSPGESELSILTLWRRLRGKDDLTLQDFWPYVP
jgi:hypothetical protein